MRINGDGAITQNRHGFSDYGNDDSGCSGMNRVMLIGKGIDRFD